MLKPLAIACALIAGACAAAAASAQSLPASAQRLQSSPVRGYHLMQLTVKSAHVSLAQFAARTRGIGSCGDAKALIEPLGASWSRNRFVRASQLPPVIRDLLEDQPTGTASPILTATGDHMSVFIICHRL